MNRYLIIVTLILLALGFIFLNWYDNDSPTKATTITPQRVLLLKPNQNYKYDNITKSHSECQERRNIVFVKTHKTGTSTFVNILYRFGWLRGLTYAIYPYLHQLGYISKPSLMRDIEVSKWPSKTSKYNIMCQHMIYNQRIVLDVMPEDAFHFSLLREPTKAFISFFIFYGYDSRMKRANKGLSLEESIRKYLKSVPLNANKSSFLVDTAINSMSFDLGMAGSSGRKVSLEEIDKYIDKIDKQFGLMMLLEHFDESLILLKNELCWQFEDIFYLNRMQSVNKDRSHETLSDELLSLLKRYLKPDYKLYNHFKDKLLDKISKQPSPAFEDSVKELRVKRKQFEEKCIDMTVSRAAIYGTLTHPLTSYGSSNINCSLLHERDVILTKLISAMQDAKEGRRQSAIRTAQLRYRASNYYQMETDFPRKTKLKS